MDLRNIGPTTEAESLLDAFERCPGELDEQTARAAITLAKQMRMELDELNVARKDDTAELRRQLADQERPYKVACEQMESARKVLLERLAAFLEATGQERLKNELGLQAYTKRSMTFAIENPEAVPDAYKRLVIDEDLIMAALKRGATIPGVRRDEKISTIVV